MGAVVEEEAVDEVTGDQLAAEEDTDEADLVVEVANDVALVALLLIVQCLEAAAGHTHHPEGSALVPVHVPINLTQIWNRASNCVKCSSFGEIRIFFSLYSNLRIKVLETRSLFNFSHDRVQ